MYYFIFCSGLLQIKIDVIGENGRGIRRALSSERMKYPWHLFLYKKKAKYSVGYGTPITCVPLLPKTIPGEKKNLRTAKPFLLLYNYGIPTYYLSLFVSLTLFLPHPLSPSRHLYVYIHVPIYLLYYIRTEAFFISRHVSKKVTLPEWHIFLAGTINSHHSKITSRTMNNGPYFYRNLSLSAARKPYTQQYTLDGAAGESIVPANYLYGGDLTADAVFVIAEMLSFVITYYTSFGNMPTTITAEK